MVCLIIFIIINCNFNNALSEDLDKKENNSNKFKLIVGGLYLTGSPEIHYKKHDDSYSKVDVYKRYSNSSYEASPYIKFEYDINNLSYINLMYSFDETETSASAIKKVKFLFYNIRVGIRVPVDIKIQEAKFYYNRVIIEKDKFSFGGSLGFQVLIFNAKANSKIWGNENYEYNYTAPFPSFGIFANYKQNDLISYKINMKYFSIGSISFDKISIGGIAADTELYLDYKYAENIYFGFGHRISYINVEIDDIDYGIKGSRLTHGPFFYVKVAF